MPCANNIVARTWWTSLSPISVPSQAAKYEKSCSCNMLDLTCMDYILDLSVFRLIYAANQAAIIAKPGNAAVSQ